MVDSQSARAEKRGNLREACAEVALARLVGRQVACLVVNRSVLGMRLRFGAPTPLDSMFVLQDVETKTCVRVRLVWTKGVEAGVRIEP